MIPLALGSHLELVLHPGAAPGFIGALFLILALAVFLLYRRELVGMSPLRRWLLLALRTLVFSLLAFLILLEPVFLIRKPETRTLLAALDLSSSMDIQDPGTSQPRRELLGNFLAEANLLKGLPAVEMLGFDSGTRVLTPSQAADVLAHPFTTNDRGTDLGLPLKAALDANQDLLGILVFSDGRHNQGISPLTFARELKKRAIPVFAVGVGAASPPPDVAVLELSCPPNILKGTEALIQVRIQVSGLPAQKIAVELKKKNQPIGQEFRQEIDHGGTDRVYFLSFQVPFEEAGLDSFTVQAQAARSEPPEISLANNRLERTLQVAEDKIRVLLIDGEARWEYHYLANAFLRDGAVQLDRVLFAAPKLGLLKPGSKETTLRTELPSLPENQQDPDPLSSFDCIILGDVQRENLAAEEQKRLERYVAEGGGTLIVSAGKRAMPLDYFLSTGEEPVQKLLPLVQHEIYSPEEGFTWIITPEGQQTPFLQLDSDPEANRRQWKELPAHFWGVVGQPRPGAKVLVQASGPKSERERALVFEQPFGLGRVVFLGVDSTWRWRYRLGDALHHRFWGQVVRWAAGQRILPAENSWARFGSRSPVYSSGQPVELVLRQKEGVRLPGSTRVGFRVFQPGEKEPKAEIFTHVREGQAGTRDAVLRDLLPGTYEVRPFTESGIFPEEMKAAAFTIIPEESREVRDLATNFPLLEQLAQETGGMFQPLDQASRILHKIAERNGEAFRPQEFRPWRDPPWVWLLLILIVGLLGLEWIVRKSAGLP